MESSITLTAVPRKGRGRPAIVFDNKQVQHFLSDFWSLREASMAHPVLETIFTGASRLQSERQGSTRPLSASLIYKLLRQCDIITSENISGCFRSERSKSTIARYAGAARVASMFIWREIERRPSWRVQGEGYESDYLFPPI